MSTVTISRAKARPVTPGRSTASRASLAARRHDRRRPRLQAWHPTNPGGRPRQPGLPLAAASYQVSDASSAHASSQQVWRLTDRGLAVIMASFTLALLLGSFVVVTQYLALGAGI